MFHLALLLFDVANNFSDGSTLGAGEVGGGWETRSIRSVPCAGGGWGWAGSVCGEWRNVGYDLCFVPCEWANVIPCGRVRHGTKGPTSLRPRHRPMNRYLSDARAPDVVSQESES